MYQIKNKCSRISITVVVITVFLFWIQNTYSQKNNSFHTKYINAILTDSAYTGKVILFEHHRGKLHLKLSNDLKSQKYVFSDIDYAENSVGDFNQNGIKDIFATIHIKKRNRDESYICLIERNNDIVNVYSYFEMSFYSSLNIEQVRNDTLLITSKMWGVNKEPYLDRTLSVIHDKKDIVRIVTPSKLDQMKDISIFRSDVENVEKERFVSNNIIRSQYERYQTGNLSITAELFGFNDFNLRFTVVASNTPSDFQKDDFIFEMFEWLESNTRFPTILTKIENELLLKNEQGIRVSNKLAYDIKNYLTPNSYFMIGENENQYNSFLFDLIYVEAQPN